MTARQKIFWLRLATLIGLCLPALELAWRWYTGGLEPRPVTAATHATGDWAVIFLMLSLAMTPARALFDWMPLIHIRRRIGVAAACYAGAHFLIYVLDQKWDLIVVATVTGRGPRSSVIQRQASSSAGRHSPTKVARRSQKILR